MDLWEFLFQAVTFGGEVRSNDRMRLSKRRHGAKSRFSKMVRFAM
jgi:hypothetical protein